VSIDSATQEQRTGAPKRDELTLLRDGEAAFPAMIAAIEGARRDIVLEMYWFDDSPIARKVIDALTARARAGVSVRVIYDAFGSIGSDSERFHALIEAGGKVIEFNPVAPWRRRFRLGWISQRDHRKFLVVDGTDTYIGGLNIGAPWAPSAQGGGGWRDDVAHVTGPAAARLRQLFFDTWQAQGGEVPPDVHRRDGRLLLTAAQRACAPDDGQAAVLGHDALGARMVMRRTYLQRIRAAEHRILIANSYFLPDGGVRRALERAARRGVEVRVIVPRNSDVPAVAWACRHTYARLMKAHVHVHEWLPSVLHSKTAVIDAWATTGSYNFDYLSWRYNLEANIASTDVSFVTAVERSLRDDLARCEEVDPVVWSRRPWSERIRDGFFHLFRKFL
jgi:cardiolipin synthase